MSFVSCSLGVLELDDEATVDLGRELERHAAPRVQVPVQV
jgi:hypothetical protein